MDSSMEDHYVPVRRIVEVAGVSAEFIARATDDELDSIFSPRIDGLWSVQTRNMPAFHQAIRWKLDSNWHETHQRWRCPVCKRVKTEIARLNGPMFVASLHCHHDHILEDFSGPDFSPIDLHRNPELVPRAHSANAGWKLWFNRQLRFPTTLVCNDCNVAEATAKLKTGADEFFSFRPEEIALFIDPEPNRPHQPDIKIARDIYESEYFDFQWRREMLACGLAKLSVDPFAFGTFSEEEYRAIMFSPIEKYDEEVGLAAAALAKRSIAQGSPTGQGKKKRPTRPLRIPTEADLMEHVQQHIRKTSYSSSYSRYSRLLECHRSGWRCPVCERTAFETLRWNKKQGDWTGFIQKNDYTANLEVCSDCFRITDYMGQAGFDTRGAYQRLGPYGMRGLLRQIRPHMNHEVDLEKVAQVLERKTQPVS